MANEKEYTFLVASRGNMDENYVGHGMKQLKVKASKLEKWQEDLLIGEAIKAYDNLTEELQMRFVRLINNR